MSNKEEGVPGCPGSDSEVSTHFPHREKNKSFFYCKVLQVFYCSWHASGLDSSPRPTFSGSFKLHSYVPVSEPSYHLWICLGWAGAHWLRIWRYRGICQGAHHQQVERPPKMIHLINNEVLMEVSVEEWSLGVFIFSSAHSTYDIGWHGLLRWQKFSWVPPCLFLLWAIIMM